MHIILLNFLSDLASVPAPFAPSWLPTACTENAQKLYTFDQ